jgi:hypothetical protein
MGLLKQHAAPRPDRVPKGLLTSEQWAAIEQLSPITAQKMLRRLVRSGKWISRAYRIPCGGVIRPVPHYAPKKAGGKAG